MRKTLRALAPRRGSRFAELQWVPGGDANLRSGVARGDFAVVDAELGDRDWSSIDPQPVRRSVGVRHGFTPAAYFWHRTGEHIWCESQQERWELLWLDYSGDVDRVWSQPVIVNFGSGSKLAGESHIPDFFGQSSTGAYSLWDVRPSDLMSDHAKRQFDETARICRELGWGYEVLTGHDRRATRSLYCIASSRHDRCKPPLAVEIELLTAARRGKARSELCALASPDCPPLAAAWVDNLAWRRLLEVDLVAPLRNDTVYKTSTGPRVERFNA